MYPGRCHAEVWQQGNNLITYASRHCQSQRQVRSKHSYLELDVTRPDEVMTGKTEASGIDYPALQAREDLQYSKRLSLGASQSHPTPRTQHPFS